MCLDQFSLSLLYLEILHLQQELGILNVPVTINIVFTKVVLQNKQNLILFKVKMETVGRDRGA